MKKLTKTEFQLLKFFFLNSTRKKMKFFFSFYLIILEFEEMNKKLSLVLFLSKENKTQNVWINVMKVSLCFELIKFFKL